MSKLPPSIFNDVIGPVMRGPSSSHTAASVRIGKVARALMGQPIKKAVFEFDPSGSLATTYDGQGSDIGLAAGLMGFEMEDERIKNALQIASESGLQLEFLITPYENDHPNTYKMNITGENGSKMQLTAISTGGGMIEYTNVDGFRVSLKGDYYDGFVVFKKTGKAFLNSIIEELKQSNGVDKVVFQKKNDKQLLHIQSSSGPCEDPVYSLKDKLSIEKTYFSGPVVPVLSRCNISVPFSTADQALGFTGNNLKESWEVAALYESQRSGFSVSRVLEMMEDIVDIMDMSIQKGLRGTEYQDRILGRQSHLIEHAMSENKLLPVDLVNKIIASTMAMMEVKSSMGLIVAAPTAGSCATIPGTLITTGKKMNLSNKEIAKSLLIAGLVGVFIAEKSTFSAELAGCQAECGCATGMAAAGLVQIAGGTLKQSFDAASMALQNIFGLACDPVANRVEVPCLGKNILAAMNALTSANMALAGVNAVIPLDEVIDAMDITGRSLPYEIRCTGYGGLCLTPTAVNLKEKMK